MARGFWHLFRHFPATLRMQERRPLQFSRIQFPAMVIHWLDISCTITYPTVRAELPEGRPPTWWSAPGSRRGRPRWTSHRYIGKETAVLQSPGGNGTEDSLLSCSVRNGDLVCEICVRVVTWNHPQSTGRVIRALQVEQDEARQVKLCSHIDCISAQTSRGGLHKCRHRCKRPISAYRRQVRSFVCLMIRPRRQCVWPALPPTSSSPICRRGSWLCSTTSCSCCSLVEVVCHTGSGAGSLGVLTEDLLRVRATINDATGELRLSTSATMSWRLMRKEVGQ